jgi:hypothetical protein
VGSGLGDAKTVKTQEGLIGLDVDEIKHLENLVLVLLLVKH